MNDIITYQQIKPGWKTPQPHNRDDLRIEAIKSLNVETLPDKNLFDFIVWKVAQYFNAPIVLISIVGKSEQKFLAKYGLDIEKTDNQSSFCAHAIRSDEDYFLVPDSCEDDRFYANPFVIGEPHIRSYLSVNLNHGSNIPIGTLCILDDKPRFQVSEEEIFYLHSMAELTMRCIEMAYSYTKLQETQNKLLLNNQEFSEFIYRVSHDFKGPLVSSLGILKQLENSFEGINSQETRQSLKLVSTSLERLEMLIKRSLELTELKNAQNGKFHKVNIKNVIKSALEKNKDRNNFQQLKIKVNDRLEDIFVSRPFFLSLILDNIVTNAFDYLDDKKSSYLHIRTYEEKDRYILEFKDNGLGIPHAYEDDIFQMFKKFHPHKSQGTGLGLYLSKQSANMLGGDLMYQNKDNETAFILAIPTGKGLI